MELRAKILTQAKNAVLHDRADAYGPVERSFEQIAALWSTRLNRTITAHEVAIMMIDLKTVRAWNNPAHEDSWVDIAGYAACGAECRYPVDTTIVRPYSGQEKSENGNQS